MKKCIVMVAAALMVLCLGVVGCSSDSSSQKPAEKKSTAELAIGATAELSDGLSVTVNSVQGGLKNYDGSDITGVNVTYTNGGDKSASFNVFDWKMQDAQGAQRSTTYYSNAENDLNSGSLAKGGTVTGNIYFDGAGTKIVYEPLSFVSQKEEVSWVIA